MIIRFIFLVFFATLTSFVLSHAKERLVYVKTTKIISDEVFDKYNIVGQCKAGIFQEYYSNSKGRITDLRQSGSVKKGDMILGIDKQVHSSSLKYAESKYLNSKRDLEINTKLYDKKLISFDKFADIKTMLHAAESEYHKSLENYRNAVIHAPFDGYIGTTKFKVGSNVNIGDFLFSIISIDSDYEVLMEIPYNFLSKIENGVEFQTENHKKDKLIGEIKSVENYLHPESLSIFARGTLKNNAQCLHNSFVPVQLMLDKRNSYVVPEVALQRNNRGNYIYIVGKDNIAKQIMVNVGTRIDGNVEISGDINQGDNIVISGLTKLSDGFKVKINNIKEAY